MRTLSFVVVLMIVGAGASSANAQALDISQLLGMLGDLGAGPSADQGGSTPTGGTPTGGTPTDGTPSGGTPSGGGDVGDGGATDQPLIPQENLRAFRSRRPGLLVTSGIARYKERTANLGRVGPSQVPLPDVPQDNPIVPVIINDLLGSFFDIVDQIVTGMTLLTSFQSGTLGSGAGGGLDINSLLQQQTGQQSTTGKEVVTQESSLTGGQVEQLPEPSQAVVVPVVPSN